MDVGRKQCDTVVCVFNVIPQQQGTSIKKLVNIFVLTDEHFEDQAIRLKQLYYKFKARRIVIDANGLGIGLVDYMIKTQVNPETNETYFADHYLPSPLWRGWKPEISLQNVKAKAIKNEAGLVPSDFGIYSSQYSDPEVIEAPELNLKETGDGILISTLKLEAMLSGAGLLDTEVSVEPRQDSRIEVIANIARIVPYNINRGIENLLGF